MQVNTLAAEKLYSLAGDWAGLGPDTLLFDVCCGTGTIGLTLARRVGMVIVNSLVYLKMLLTQLNAWTSYNCNDKTMTRLREQIKDFKFLFK